MKNETVRDRLAGLEHQLDTLRRQLLEIRELAGGEQVGTLRVRVLLLEDQNKHLQGMLTGANDVLAQVAAERDRLRDELAQKTQRLTTTGGARRD